MEQVRRTGSKNRVFRFGLLAAVLLAAAFLFAVPVSGAGIETIYVAGSQDHAPFEYYDQQREEYRGIFPDLLEEISRQSGLQFAYLSPGEPKEQQAGNLQAEIVSDISREESQELELSYCGVFSFEEDGDQREIGFAFTSIASEQLKEQFQTALEELGPSAREQLLISYLSAEKEDSSYLVWGLATACGILVLLLAVALVLFWKRRKKDKEKIELFKRIDPATGYSNLYQLKQDYESFVNDGNRALYAAVELLLENLRHFQELSAWGEADKISKAAAAVLEEFVGENEMFASAGGDRFYLLIQFVSETAMTERLRQMSKRLSGFCGKEAGRYPLELRWGVYHLDTSDWELESCLTCASQARIYAAEHKLPFVLYNQEIGRSVSKVQQMEREVLSAFCEEDFIPYYQPKVDLHTGKIVGAEALARWRNKTQGFLPASQFIPILEQSGVVDQLDYLIFEKVCQMLQGRLQKGLPITVIACNFSRYCFGDDSLPDRLEQLCQNYGVPEETLEIEITESIFEEDTAQVQQIIDGLKKKGFRVALDDFGAQYASIHDLEVFQLDAMKLDRSLIQNIGTAKTDSILKGIIEVAHSLELQVVCEGVENQRMADSLKQAGCDVVQGYYFCQPVPYEELDQMLTAEAK